MYSSTSAARAATTRGAVMPEMAKGDPDTIVVEHVDHIPQSYHNPDTSHILRHLEVGRGHDVWRRPDLPLPVAILTTPNAVRAPPDIAGAWNADKHHRANGCGPLRWLKSATQSDPNPVVVLMLA